MIEENMTTQSERQRNTQSERQRDLVQRTRSDGNTQSPSSITKNKRKETDEKSQEDGGLQKKKRSPQCIRKTKYVTFCARNLIPYPTLNKRESEHLDVCDECKELWPLFLFKNQYVLNLPFERVTEDFSNLSETARLILLKELKKEDLQWHKSFVHCRPPSAYQLFLKEKHTTNSKIKSLKFGDSTALIAKIWSKSSEEEKKVFYEKSDLMKEEHKQKINDLPAFKKKMFEIGRRQYLKKLKANRPLKAANPFIIFLNEKWAISKLENNSSIKHKDMMTKCSLEWAAMTGEQKSVYQLKFINMKQLNAVQTEAKKSTSKKSKMESK